MLGTKFYYFFGHLGDGLNGRKDARGAMKKGEGCAGVFGCGSFFGPAGKGD